MTTRRLAAPVLLLGCALMGLSANQQPASSRVVALTFDDLPFVAVDAAYLPAARRATTKLLDVLATHRAPAIGFVNEVQLDGPDREARIALLEQWIHRGMLLGNHTYSHPDFNKISIEQFQEEILKGEAVTRRLLESRPSSRLFFRHPMTHTGDTKEKKEAIEKFLAARGYTIAPHTIENSDFVFNRVYARALAKNDRALAGKVRAAYLDFTMDVTAFAESASPKIFGREIAQTLLLHANDLNADCLDDLLTRYEGRGYRFVTLEQAMADPAYSTPDTMVTAYGPTWLWRWRTSLGLKVSFTGDPEVPAWVTELFNRSFSARP
jgi:peptidoglycan/xylan/chitin deacetylase (PgdA/CDA1 family)